MMMRLCPATRSRTLQWLQKQKHSGKYFVVGGWGVPTLGELHSWLKYHCPCYDDAEPSCNFWLKSFCDPSIWIHHPRIYNHLKTHLDRCTGAVNCTKIGRHVGQSYQFGQWSCFCSIKRRYTYLKRIHVTKHSKFYGHVIYIYMICMYV